ncbi:MAG: hypothetical protein AAF202_06345, partial [Pseudomonadota bacterium]
MKNSVAHFAIVLACFAYSLPSLALDVVKVVTNQCKSEDGIVINIADNRLSIMNFAGQVKSVDIPQIQMLALYNLYENPVSKIQPSPELNKLLKVFSPADEEPIKGWAVRFVQDLVFVYDVNGNSHVLDLYEINKIRDPKKPMASQARLSYKPTNLSLSGVST